MKIVINPNTPISAVSLAASKAIALPEIFDCYGFSLQLSFSAGNNLVGTLGMQVSLDGVDWFDYTGFTAVTDFTIATLWYADNKVFPFKYAQLNWVRTSGTGTVTAIFAACRP